MAQRSAVIIIISTSIQDHCYQPTRTALKPFTTRFFFSDDLKIYTVDSYQANEQIKEKDVPMM